MDNIREQTIAVFSKAILPVGVVPPKQGEKSYKPSERPTNNADT